MSVKPVIEVTVDDVKGIIAAQNGKFFTADFIGKHDRKTHQVNGRTGVYKFSRGGKNHASGKDDLISCFNVKKMGYRIVNVKGVSEIRANGVIYRVC